MSDREDAAEPGLERDGELGSATAAMKGAAIVVAVEALALVAVGVAELFNIDSDRVALGVTNVVFFMLYGGVLLLSARALAAARSWSRSPIVLTQLIQLGVAWSFAGNPTTWVSALLAVPAVGVLAVAIAPSTTLALYGRREDAEPAEHD